MSNRAIFWFIVAPLGLLVVAPIVAVWTAGAVLLRAPAATIAELREVHRRLP